MRGDVLDALAVDVDFAAVTKRFQKLRAGEGPLFAGDDGFGVLGHLVLPLIVAWIKRHRCRANSFWHKRLRQRGNSVVTNNLLRCAAVALVSLVGFPTANTREITARKAANGLSDRPRILFVKN